MANTRVILTVVLVATALTSCAVRSDVPKDTSSIFDDPWNSGTHKSERPLQVQRYDPATIVIRQSLRTSFEAPFMYLLFGESRALLVDTGAGGVDLRSTVDLLVNSWLESSGRESVELVVMHTHGHGDHIAGDDQFVGRQDTVIVGHAVRDVVDFFQIENWPESSSSFDLGGRIVDVIPTPGHHDSHVMVFDRATRLLLSGDTIYPGRLYFQCGKAYEFRRTMDRVLDFADNREISWILGAHIELSQQPGKSFDSNDLVRVDERLLELAPTTIGKIQQSLMQMGDDLRVQAFQDFILFPHPADPRGQKPPDWCLNDQATN